MKLLCTICGKELINQPLATEGGLLDRWSCPVHGTRGRPMSNVTKGTFNSENRDV